MLTEARKEQDNLPVLHQPSKKTETEVTFMRCIQRLSHVYVIVPACFAEHCVTVTVTVTEALVLRPLLEDRGRITESIRILVPVNRIKQKCFQVTTEQVCRSQQFQFNLVQSLNCLNSDNLQSVT